MKVIGIGVVALLVAGCFFVPPTTMVSLEEVENFLVNDTTSERVYNNCTIPYYTCGHFTKDLVANASKKGIRMYPVYLTPREGSIGHIIAAVKVNGTWVFIEPINDGVYPEKSLLIFKRTYRSYWIGTQVRCSPDSTRSGVSGVVERGEMVNIDKERTWGYATRHFGVLLGWLVFRVI